MASINFRRLTLILLGFALAAEGRPAPGSNSTIIVDENDPHIYCEKSVWYDVCWFIFSNYVLHALSVRSLPGENTYSTTLFKLCCLCVPYAGLRRGLCLISRASNLAGNDLQCAARANALCMVIRTAEWRPRDGDVIDGCKIDVVDSVTDHAPLQRSKSSSLFRIKTWETMKSTKSKETSKSSKYMDADGGRLARTDSTVARNTWRYRNHLKLQIKDPYNRPSCQNVVETITRRLIETYRFYTQNPTDSVVDHVNVKIHGYCELAPGYALCYIPADMKVYPRYGASVTNPALPLCGSKSKSGRSSKTHIASAHDFPRIIFSLVQTFSGGYALYKARGPQIERYGFAAFGLTVIPYILVSVVNFFGALLTSEYETVFLVHSSIMDEMVARGGCSDGAVGTTMAPTNEPIETTSPKREERVEIPSKSLTFLQQQNDILHCHDDTTTPPQTYQITPYEPPLPPSASKLKFIPNRSNLPIPNIWHLLKLPPTPSLQPSSHHHHPTSTLTIPSHPSFTHLPRPRYQLLLDLFSILLLITAVLAPYLINYLLTEFKANQSTSTQRNFLLNWLICGQLQGYLIWNVEKLTGKTHALKGLLYVFLCYGSFCLGGFVIVAEEMVEFGDCRVN